MKISSGNGEDNFSFRTKKVCFPEKKWKEILSKSKEDTVFITIYSKKGDKWEKYKPSFACVGDYWMLVVIRLQVETMGTITMCVLKKNWY